jgi:hypothetical protein
MPRAVPSERTRITHPPPGDDHNGPDANDDAAAATSIDAQGAGIHISSTRVTTLQL